MPPATAPAPVAVTGHCRFGPVRALLERLRSQLAGGQYHAALSTLDSLRATVADRAKAGTATPGGK